MAKKNKKLQIMSETSYNNKPIYTSKVVPANFINRLTSLFGWKSSRGLKTNTPFEASTGLKMVSKITTPYEPFLKSYTGQKNPEFFRKMNYLFKDTPFNETFEKLLDYYLRNNTNDYQDLIDRERRINELEFMWYNDPFISRVVTLVADEATQIDMQDRIITVTSPDPIFTEKTYQLFTKWGITQNRIHAVCHDLELFGESFWSVKITDKGVEKIIPIRVRQVLERLEFNPIKVLEEIQKRYGNTTLFLNRGHYIKKLLDYLQENLDIKGDVTDIFETKLFGFVLSDGTVVPPWSIIHFRRDADHSEFYPYGRPHLIACLAPFKQTSSIQALQVLARLSSFPITLYKVKVPAGYDDAMAWEYVNTVRENYDNMGVVPTSIPGDTYTINTKLWLPDNLMDVEVKKSDVEIDFVKDLELSQDRVVVATGIPKGYLVQEWGGFGNSAISLVEQFKPFARHVFTIQTAFLEGLSDLIRLHFIITKEFDPNIPFTLSLKFPGVEISEARMTSRKSSLELAEAVIEFLKKSLGLEDNESLPLGIVKDILSKYTFLNPTDILRWTNYLGAEKLSKELEGEEEEEGEEEGEDFEDLFGGEEEVGEEEVGGEEETPSEMPEHVLRNKDKKRLLNEIDKVFLKRKAVLKKLKEDRLKEINKRYKECKDQLFVESLVRNNIKEYSDGKRHTYVSTGFSHYSLENIFEVLGKDKLLNPEKKLKTLKEVFEDIKKEKIEEDSKEFEKILEILEKNQEKYEIDSFLKEDSENEKKIEKEIKEEMVREGIKNEKLIDNILEDFIKLKKIENQENKKDLNKNIEDKEEDRKNKDDK